MARPTHAHDWLSLVSLSGLLVSEPVLAAAFPDGPEKPEGRLVRRFATEWERFRLAQGADPQGRWVDFVLYELLGCDPDRVLRGAYLPAKTIVDLLDFNQTLRPSRVLVGADGAPRLLISIVPTGQELDRTETVSGRWKASPTTKLDRLLRESGAPLGLLTNGREWRLIYATSGVSETWLTWSSQTWADERITLDAFYTLLNATRFYGEPKGPTLLDLIRRSQERQADVADQLGEQVRAAVELFVRALDASDAAHGGALLTGMPLDRIYEMSISLMMRLVFIFYAEENGLLPHGEMLWDRSYGLTYLVSRLEAERRADAETMARTTDAWGQLLAAFRLIHDGCPHPDLALSAYGGDLFDPMRYLTPDPSPRRRGEPDSPLPLQGEEQGGRSLLEDPRLQITNTAIYTILRKLTVARTRIGTLTLPQRVSYRSLGIEQIGTVYEGLLDHRLARAGAAPLLKLKGAAEPVLRLAELATLPAERRAAEIARLTGRSETTVANELAAVDADDVADLAEDVGPELASQAGPFAGVITAGGVIPPGRLYLTAGPSRRIQGAHFTGQVLTEPIVETTLGPLVYEQFEPVAGPDGAAKWQGRGLKPPAAILALKVCDMTMGCGAFLVQADRYLADRLADAWDQIEAAAPGIRITPFGEPSSGRPEERLLPAEHGERVILARRLIAERCLYGVDKNPLAVEIARLSLWLATLAKDRPFTFLDHALKPGDSLAGCDVEAFLRWAEDSRGPQISLLQETLREHLEAATRARRELQAFVVLELGDAERKAALHAKAETALARIKLGCDLLIGVEFAEPDAKARAAARAGLLVRYTAGESFDGCRERPDDPAGRALRAADTARPFHWPFEFPEVFLPPGADPTTPAALLDAGFDAFVGNPPFMGGQHIRSALGSEYLRYLKTHLVDRKGSADLCAYFYLGAFNKLRRGGRFGLIATNTIAQGDTREVGLETIVQKGGTIYAAIPSMPWPGAAAVYVSVVHVAKGPHFGQRLLDNRLVSALTPLLDDTSVLASPHRLAQNKNLSFQGSNLWGAGFIISAEEAELLIAHDPLNARVLFPYLNGQDLNSSPDQSPSRWVVNFHDWSLEDAEKFIEPMAIVRERVRPARELIGRDRNRERWWIYGENRPGLYRAIASLPKVLVVALTSRTCAFAIVPTGMVFAHAIGVFAFSKTSFFAVLQSTLHVEWAWKYGSSLKGDLRYTPSDVFETFPVPQYRDSGHLAALDRVGEAYHEHRRQVMLARQEGLTKTYNRFHDPACADGDIAELRRLHVEMDAAVLAAYGWSDVPLDHDFRGAGKEARFTLSEGVKEELLRRLLLLNFEIAAREEKDEAQAEVKAKRGKTQAADRLTAGKKDTNVQGRRKKTGGKGHLNSAEDQPALL